MAKKRDRDLTKVEFLSEEEVAEILDVCRSTLWRLRKRREGPEPARIGGRLVYRRGDVERWFDEMKMRTHRRGMRAI